MKLHHFIALLGFSVCTYAATKIIRSTSRDNDAAHYIENKITADKKSINTASFQQAVGDEPIEKPDAPQAMPNTPNSIGNLPVPNPADKINVIEAPVANSMGSAVLSFPIKIPDGRNGMQPDLSIVYNSEAPNSWLGIGWGLQVSSIAIETRWGVPRYDASLETETYLLDGEQLSPVAHRATAVARSGEKQFYPRVENTFEKIIRHNSGTATYWWEVIEKNGTRRFFGGSPATGLDANAVLTDANGNIAQWSLTESRDLNGNFVKYRYTKVADAGNAGGSTGSEIYLSSVTYTGNGTAEGKYAVEFTRDRQLGETKRQDVLINARWGFKQVTADLLRKVAVKYNGQTIRTYELNYTQGAFYKTLLQRITEFDAAGTLFNTHNFEYYNDVQGQQLSAAEQWSPQNDNIKGTFLNPIPLFDDKASALSGNKSMGGGFGLAITIGPYDANNSMKTNTAGVSFGFNYSRNEGMLALVDINGDGLIDKVFKKNGNLSYRPNRAGPGGSVTFGNEQPVNGISDFSRGESFTGDIGLESHFGIFAGFEYARTEDITSVYFADVNGDRLMDIVKDGRVYFNHLDGNGNPSFTLSSGDTPSPIDAASGIDGSIVENNPQDLEAAIDDHPLQDVVKVWCAPFDGVVSISRNVALVQDNSPDAQAYTAADGVRVAIQHKGTELWATDIAANDFTPKTPVGVNAVAVQKGDRIYFRVQSKFNGAYDQVSWSPQVTYSNHTAALTDANALPLYQFTSDNDFLISGPLSISMTINGQVKITGDFSKPVTSDDVTVKIVKRSGNAFSTLLQQTLAANSASTLPVDITQNVTKGDALFFSVVCNTNIDWTALHWNPFVYYNTSADPAITQLFDLNNKPLLYSYPTVDFQSFNKTIRPTASWTVPASDTFSIQAKPDLNFTLESGSIVFSVKKQNELLAKQVIPVVNGAVGAHPALSLILNSGDKLFFEYHIKEEKLANTIDTSYVVVDADPGTPETLIAGLHTEDNTFLFGPMYRHWGQFAYNGNRARASQPIIESDLHLDETLTDDTPPSIDLSGASTAEEMQNIYANAGGNQPKEDKFIYLVPDNERKLWIGYDDLAYVKKDVISSSRMGKDNLLPVNPITVASPGAGAGAVGITKVANTDNFSLAAGIGPLGGSASFGYTKFLYDFTDINGDLYPDVLSTNKIQYTHPFGGLEPAAKNFSFGDVSKSEHVSAGFTLGGTFLRSNAANSKFTAKGAKATKAADQSGISAGISGNFNYNEDSTAFAWIDINGDDLLDRVHRNGMVELNLGYSFLAPEQWGYASINHGTALSYGAGFSINISNYSISAGVGLSRSENETNRSLTDMNGDGMPDYITGINPLMVAINTGNGFAAPVQWNGAAAIHKGTSTGESINAAFTIGITLIPVVPVVKLCINPSFNFGQGSDKTTLQFDDVDGDGFPDLLQSDQDNQLTVSRSTIRRTNKLKKVNRPLGANFTLDYERTGNTYEMPNSVWALSVVDIYDGLPGDGADRMRNTFKYEGGHFDRHEREFFGFKKVTTFNHDTQNSDNVYRKTEVEFLNDNFYEKGLLKSEVLKNAAGNKFTETVNTYQLKDIHTGATLANSIRQSDDGAAFPALIKTEELFYEGNATAGKSTSTEYTYDALGNTTVVKDFGDAGAADDITTAISYHSVPAKYIVGIASAVTVTGNGQTYRQTASTIDVNTGNITESRRFLESGDVARTNMEYDAFGNIVKITRPQNATGQRLSFTYEYDADVKIYRTKTTDGYGYTSSATYDVRFGQVLSSTDINGQQTLTTIDDVGRVKTIRGPLEIASGQPFTLSYEYHPGATVPWAIVKQFDPANPANFIERASFCDGLQRIVQIKKDGAIFTGALAADQEVMIVSGADKYDAFGRKTAQYYRTTEAKGNTGVLNNNTDAVNPTLYTYDVLDRTLVTTLPDLVITSAQYSFGNDRDGVQQFKTKLTDGNGVSTEQFTNVRDLVKAVKQQHSQGTDVWTSYTYNGVDELVKVTDDKGNNIVSAYDRMGRRTSVSHPDAGVTSYQYDLNNNITQENTANLQSGAGIKYTYEFERLIKLSYPQNAQNNTTITYGAAGAAFFRAGRLVTVQDASGTQEFFYNPLGAEIKNKRTITIPGSSALTYTTEWTYDTWNRLTAMLYPDGEALTYNYNVGGLLRSMSGIKSGTTYNYMPQAGYDKFEKKVYMRYGNGSEMTYAYEPARRRLKKLFTKLSTGRIIMDNSYTYDNEENILGVVNDATVPPANLMGGKSNYQYTYDDLYRLTKATGSFEGSNHVHRFTVNMQYDNLYSIISKSQVHERKAKNASNWVLQGQTSYNYNYDYNTAGKPHAAVHIGDKAYSYDANGNQTGWQADGSAQRRNISWDEENRLKTLADNGQTFNYTYDASNERVLKSIGNGQTVRVNGKPAAQTGGLGNYIVYVNPYMVVRSGGFTKHFYIEGGRITSKLGESGNGNGNGNGGGGNGNNQESVQFYYHTDHLHNTAFVTDKNGEVYQHLEYFPFGETFIEEHSNQERTPYLYGAKELDEETGLYYFGARYYDTKTGVWQSVDPLWELPQEVSTSPYAYVLDNPVLYEDPDGAGKKKQDDDDDDYEPPGGGVQKGDPRYRRVNWRGKLFNHLATKQSAGKGMVKSAVSTAIHAKSATKVIVSKKKGTKKKVRFWVIDHRIMYAVLRDAAKAANMTRDEFIEMNHDEQNLRLLTYDENSSHKHEIKDPAVAMKKAKALVKKYKGTGLKGWN